MIQAISKLHVFKECMLPIRPVAHFLIRHGVEEGWNILVAHVDKLFPICGTSRDSKAFAVKQGRGMSSGF